MSILISGSLAYDTIMDFPDRFGNHILPDQIHILNVCFVVEQLKKNFGGTAGNIAYTAKLLGGDPIILAPLGKDGSDYLEYLKKRGITTSHIPLSTEKYTAAAQITTDLDNNQITAFYNGALSEGTNLHISDIKKDTAVAIICPTDKNVMVQHASECFAKQITFCFDPGQQLTAFSAEELKQIISQAAFLTVNDYEMKLLQEKTGTTIHDLLKTIKVIVTTLGERGSVITTKEETLEIPPCLPSKIVDPTGAGDAWRAGFFTAYERGFGLEVCGRVASVAATYAIESYGTQNHIFTLDEFARRYEETYGEPL